MFKIDANYCVRVDRQTNEPLERGGMCACGCTGGMTSLDNGKDGSKEYGGEGCDACACNFGPTNAAANDSYDYGSSGGNGACACACSTTCPEESLDPQTDRARY